ncbi:MAG: hypothetical protein Q4F00_00080 [bacterium]|nr:hypothetical protein [bacterium]
MAEITLEQLEKNLEDAGEKLGMSLKNAPEEEKVILTAIYDDIKKMAEKQKAENSEAIDASALFAAAIVGHGQINDAAMIEAAVNYIDQDLAYCKFRSLERLEKNLEEAADRLGMSLKNAPEAERNILTAIYDDIKKMVEKQKAENCEPVDHSALFAAAIVGHGQINDVEVIDAAVNYIDQDLAYCRCRSGKH